MPKQVEDFERKKGLAVFLSLIFIGMFTIGVYDTWRLLTFLRDIDLTPFYFILSLDGVLLLILSPCILMLMYIVLRRHFGNLPERHFEFWAIMTLVLLPCAVVVRIGLGLWVTNYVAAKGFTPCSELTSTSRSTAKVWVRYPEYCHPESDAVKIEVRAWLDEQQAAVAKPSNDEVIAQIEQLIAEHKQRYQ